MTSSEEEGTFSGRVEIVTSSYRGPDRRSQRRIDDSAEIYQSVRSDDYGNVTLDVRTDARRRRSDDHTINLLRCLDIGSLRLDDADD